MNKLRLKVVTPEKLMYEGEVDAVVLPSMEGQITIMPNHIPLITGVKPGELKLVHGKEEEFFSITKGVIETDGDTVTLLTDACERVEELDEQRALDAMKKAKEIMSKDYKDKVGYTEAISELERAVSRIKIIKKRRGGARTSIDQNY